MEIIVVDGGSKDETHDIAMSYGGKVKWIHEPTQAVINAKNKGVAAAKNTGISNATGTYVAFLDSDDEWLPDKVSCQLSLFEKYPDVVLVSGAINNISQDNPSDRVGSAEEIYGKMLPTLLKYNPVSNSTVMIRKEILADIQPWFHLGLSTSEDWQLWIRISARWPIYISSIVMVNRHLRDESLAHSYSDAFQHVEYKKSLYGSLWSDSILSDYRDSHRNEVAASQLICYAHTMHRHNKIGEAIKYLLRASRFSPFNLHIYKGLLKFLLPKGLLKK